MPRFDWDQPEPKQTRMAALAALFRAHPGEWLEQHRLANVAGVAGFRERRRECCIRLGMTLERKRERLPSGAVLVFWRYVLPADLSQAVGEAEATV